MLVLAASLSLLACSGSPSRGFQGRQDLAADPVRAIPGLYANHSPSSGRELWHELTMGRYGSPSDSVRLSIAQPGQIKVSLRRGGGEIFKDEFKYRVRGSVLELETTRRFESNVLFTVYNSHRSALACTSDGSLVVHTDGFDSPYLMGMPLDYADSFGSSKRAGEYRRLGP